MRRSRYVLVSFLIAGVTGWLGCSKEQCSSQPIGTDGGAGAAGTSAAGHGGGGEAGGSTGGRGGTAGGSTGGLGGGGSTGQTTSLFYQTATPYPAPQDPAAYEAPPAGFSLVYSELVARHGSRGLSGMAEDLAIHNLWQKASDEGALTAIGASLGPDVLSIMKANFLLGYAVPGITKPGYGNETQLGISQHKELAMRWLARDADLLRPLEASAAGAPARQIVVVTSGVGRAVDSGGFFVSGLLSAAPGLAGLVTNPPAPAPYPAGAPVAQPAGTNRFLLYFHKLLPATDLVTDTTDPLYPTYQKSQAYQTFVKSDADLLAKQAALLTTAEAAATGRAVLERLFAKSFVDALESKSFSVANTGTMTFASADGTFSSTLTGDGKTVLTSPAEAAVALYALYAAAPNFKAESGVDMAPYMPLAQAKAISAMEDASDFYAKGPGSAEKGDITYGMAQILEDDFFNEVDAIAKGDLSHAAKLRFSHAEILIPFQALLGLKGASEQATAATPYSYDSSPWRGEIVSPMATNVQWDVVRDAVGATLLVKMLRNEIEVDFKAACADARFAPRSHFYDYAKLKSCYGHVSATP